MIAAACAGFVTTVIGYCAGLIHAGYLLKKAGRLLPPGK